MSETRLRIRRYLIWTGISLLLLLMAGLTVVSTFLATESGSRMIVSWGLARASELDGIEVDVQEIRGNLLQGLRLGTIDFSASGVRVEADSMLADWDPFSLLSGNFQLARLQLDGISVKLLDSGEVAPAATQSPLADFAIPALPVNIAIADFTVSDLRVSGGGVDGVSESSEQQIEIANIASSISLLGTELQLDSLNITSDIATISGDVTLQLSPGLPLDATLRWSYAQELPLQLGSASGEIELTGSAERLQLTHRLMTPFAIESTGLIEPFMAEGVTLDLQHRSSLIVLPEQLRSASLERVELTTRGIPSDLGFTLAAIAQLPDAPMLELSAEGDLQGTLLNLSSTIESPEGALSSAVSLDYSDGVDVSGNFSLEEPEPMALLSAFVPSSADTDFPLADLRVAGDFQLVLVAEQLSLQVTLDDAGATLDGYEIEAAGGISLADNAWQFNDLTLTSAANQLHLNGHFDETIELVWSIDAPALEQFVPGVQGRVIGAGTLSGTPEAPLVDAEFSVDALTAAFGTLNSLQLTVQGDPNDYHAALRVGGAEVLGEQSPLVIGAAALEFAGSVAQHELSLSLGGEYDGSGLSADFAIEGGFADLAAGDWQGQLLRGELLGAAGDWHLQSASSLLFSGEQFTLGATCWAYAVMQICLNLTPAADGAYAMEGSIANFPLQEFDAPGETGSLFSLAQFPRLPTGVALEGEANATLSAEFGGQSEATFNLTTTADDAVLTLRSALEDQYGAERTEEEIQEQSYTWRRLNLRGEYEEGEWRFDARAQLDTDNLQDSDLQLTGELNAELTLDAEGRLQGSSVAEFSDLGWVSAFAPEMREVSGLLESQLNIAGTLAEPQLTGRVRINEGTFYLERTGVTYSDIELNLNGTSFSSATLEGSLSTEAGQLTYSGAVQGLNSSAWHVQAQLEGDAFQVANTDDLTLQVSPALNLDANAQRIDLRGNLHVPVFNIVLRELPESAVDITRDVVIQNYPEERPDLARSYTSNQTALFDLPMSADLNLSLGDQVTFAGFGLQAALQGELEMQQQVTGASFTYGELSITEGSYRIYGQELNLQDGKLLFLGNYANPALDIRAVRAVQNQTVGVQINGTLNNMHSQLFSSPVLPESDILAVLVTGRPASELQSSDGDAMLGAIASLGIEQGQGLTEDLGNRLGLDTVAITNTGNIDSSELTIGKYLTPQVFIRYGIGLFDRFSKVAVDYMISDRLTLQAESGEYQSIDFTYRVER